MIRRALALALLCPAFASAVSIPSVLWPGKVDHKVMTATSRGEAVEFFVVMAEQADVSGAQTLRTKAEKGAFVYSALTAKAQSTQAPVLAELDALGASYTPFWITNAISVRGDLALVQNLAMRSDVARIATIGRGTVPEPVSAPTATPETVESSLQQVGADDVWALGIIGQGAVLAGADTGVAWEHPALREQYRGWDAQTGTADHSYNWFVGADTNPECPLDLTPCDDNGHGTHTMGTMVGDDGAGNQIGIAPGAQWIACRNHDDGTGSETFYLACMQFFMAPTDATGNNPDPSRAPDAVNNSWTCTEGCGSQTLQALENSVAAGIAYVTSAGNSGPDCATMQFALQRHAASFTVGATNHLSDTIAGFSSRGPVYNDPDGAGGFIPPYVGPDISAPGVGIRSSVPPSGYASLSGTSMASPHVTGLIALIISANPDLKGHVATIERIVQGTAVPRFAASNELCGDDTTESLPNNVYGWGRIDALAAVEMAQADGDQDGVADVLDNCRLVANSDQCDTNGDGFGNHCDGDLDNNGIVNSFDLNILRAEFGLTGSSDSDLNCDGVVNSFDLSLLRGMFGAPPGPGA